MANRAPATNAAGQWQLLQAGDTLALSSAITGAVSSRAQYNVGVVQSDVTASVDYFATSASTQAAAFTLTALYHFRPMQGTIGAGSAITAQYGFYADSTLIGAASNYGFYGNIAAASGRYNLYMGGTADNFLAGSLGIGGAPTAGTSVNVVKLVTGAVSAFGIAAAGAIQSDVTTSAYMFNTSVSTLAANFTLGNARHYSAAQSSVGVGSSVVNQYGFYADISIVGATNNYGFYSNITAQVAGSGTASRTITTIDLTSNVVTVTTSAAHGYVTSQVVTVAAVTNPSLNGSGIVIASTPTTTTFTYLRNGSNIVSGAETGTVTSSTRYNLYIPGSADNYMAGALGIGTSVAAAGITLQVNKTLTGGTTARGVYVTGVIQPDVTNATYLFSTAAGTAAASFTAATVVHYYAAQSTIGAGSAVTNQYGVYVDSTLVGATNNYGFYGNIAAASGRYNLYMGGTAQNYMVGQLTLAQGALTTSQPFTLTQTYNASGVTFNAFLINVTDTASATASLLMDLQVGGVTKLNVNKSGNVTIGANTYAPNANAQLLLTPNTGVAMGWQVASNGSVIHPIAYNSASLYIAIRANSIDFAANGPVRWTNGNANPTTTIDTALCRAGASNSLVFDAGSGAAGSVTSRVEINKTVTAIVDATATAVFTVTIPNTANSALIMVELDGDLGAGGTIGAFEAGAVASYRIKIVRTAGVNAVAVISTANPGAAANVVGAATCTVVGTLGAMAGAVTVANTFTINVTVTKSAGTSANHTCTAHARLLNANATGITIV